MGSGNPKHRLFSFGLGILLFAQLFVTSLFSVSFAQATAQANTSLETSPAILSPAPDSGQISGGIDSFSTFSTSQFSPMSVPIGATRHRGIFLVRTNYYSDDSTTSSVRGTFPAGLVATFYLSSPDGEWAFASDGAGKRIFFETRNILVLPEKTSTDPTLYQGLVTLSRRFYAEPSTKATIKGTLPAGSIASFYHWTSDGSWAYAGDGTGKNIYFETKDLRLFPVRTSTDPIVYAGMATVAKPYYSAPSTAAPVRGTLAAGTLISYLKWTDDGTWGFASDGAGKRIYIDLAGVTRIPERTSFDGIVRYASISTAQHYYAAPSTSATRLGTLSARGVASYYRWTDDGTWGFASDGLGRRIFFELGGLVDLPEHTSTDTRLHVEMSPTNRYYYSAPSTGAQIRGIFPAASVLSYYKWSSDGVWGYASDGAGRRIFFDIRGLLPTVKRTSFDQTAYYGKTPSERQYFSSASPNAAYLGTFPASTVLKYYKWTSDSAWIFTLDSLGRQVYCSGLGLTPMPQYFGTYIDVNLSTQSMMYIVDGYKILESNIVTGKPSTPTPAGTFSILNKQSPATLVGVGYVQPVSYWMPFTNAGHGFHDATWQPWFGGNRWLSGGSHGCVNMPLSAARDLYSRVTVGTRVSIHW